MKYLFLDDDPHRHRQFIQYTIGISKVMTATPSEAIAALTENDPFDVVCLDHDLGGKVYQPSDENSGFAVCQFLATLPADRLPKKIIIHSFNPEGAKKMRNELYEIGHIVPVTIAAFGTDDFWEAVSTENV